MRSLFLFLFLTIHAICHSQHGDLNLVKQNPDSVREELSALFTELSIKHPGYYRYNEKEAFNTFIDSTLHTITTPINELEILRKVKPLVSKIGCMHTGIRLSDKTQKYLDSFPNCLPYALCIQKGKVVVWKSFREDNPVKVGDEITKINGRDMKEVYDLLLNNIPMDGYNTSGKYKLLQYTFSGWYRNYIEVVSEFEIELANGRTHKVKAINKNETFSYADIMKQPMSLDIIDHVAVIKIPSFANSYLKSHQQQFKKEIKSYHKIINKKGVNTILLDLRGNTGGTDSNAAWLTSLFFDKPYNYWDRIEVTQPIAQDVTGVSRIFYGKPKFTHGKWLWSDKGLLSKEFKFTKTQKPSKRPFKSSNYILTDGLCMSSCADFIAIMQANKKAMIVGEETGGGYYGNTSGLIPSEQLPCGLIIDVPLLNYFNSVPENQSIGRGTFPDLELTPTLSELNRDGDYLERVLEMIKTSPDINSKAKEDH